MEEGHGLRSYRTKNWKFILNEEKNKRELYNLKNDPHETKNLYEQEKGRAKDFEKKIAEHIKIEERMKKKAMEIARIKKIKFKRTFRT